MAEQNVFGHLLPQQQTQAPPPVTVPTGSPVSPGVIYGRPKAPPVVSAQDQALKDIQIQTGQTNLAERNNPSLPQGYRWQGGIVGGTAEPIPGLPPAKDAADADVAGKQRNQWRSMMLGAGVDLERGVDPVAPLIEASTSGTLQRIGAETYGGLTGEATGGMENIQKLRTLANDMVLQLSGGSLGAQISNSDRDFMAARLGDIANPDLPYNQRLAAWEQVKQRAANLMGVQNVDRQEAAPAASSDAGYIDPVTGAMTIDANMGGDMPPAPSNGGGGFMAGVGDLVQGAGDIAGIVGNPVNATINALAGTNLSTDLGQSLRDVSGLPDNPNAVASAINRGAIGGLGVSGIAGAVRAAPGVAANVLRTMGAQPIQQSLAGGVASGTAEQLNQEGVGPLGQAAGAVLAGGLSYSGTNALTGIANRAAAIPNSLGQAAQRQGVNLLPADAGGPMTRRFTGAAAQAPISSGPVINASQQSRSQLQAAAGRAARSQGEVFEPDVMGEQVRAAGQQYIKNESSRIGKMYENAGDAAKGVTIKPLQAVAEIDSQLARFSELGDVGAPMVRELQSLRDSIANGISVQGLRDARTILSQGVYDGKLRSSADKKRMGDILNKVSSDIELGLRQAGRGQAAQQFKRADTLWRERIQTIDDVLEPVIGSNKSGEDVLGALEGMTRGQRGGVTRLRGILREMPPEESGNIRATIIDRLGKASAGAQNDTGTEFSAATFLTNWNKMSPRAKTIMFGDDNLRSNLDDIAKLASATKEAGRYANSSNTAGAIAGNLGVMGAGAFVSPPAAAAALTSQYLTGKLLASPRFAAWLARAPKAPGAQTRYIDQLGVLATREPLIAADARALQQHLQQSFGQSPGRLAAEEENNRRPEPPQR